MKPGPLSAGAWNGLLDLLAPLLRRRVMSVTSLGGTGEWRHPWYTSAVWSAVDEQWQATVKPGFVNGLDVTMLIDGKDVPLTDQPAIPLTNWRAIGEGAEPSGTIASENDDNISFTYEPVPDFFLARGVPAAGSQPSTLASSENEIRRLLACDIVLHHDRPGLTTTALGNGLSLGTRSSPAARDHGYLSTTRSYLAEAQPDPIRQLAGDWTDTTSDSVLAATVYLLSPPDTAAGEPPDETWQPFVKHGLFLNLLYGHTDIDPQPNANPLTLQTGLAAGAGDLVIQQALSQLNDQTQAALTFLANQRIEGRFWSI